MYIPLRALLSTRVSEEITAFFMHTSIQIWWCPLHANKHKCDAIEYLFLNVVMLQTLVCGNKQNIRTSTYNKCACNTIYDSKICVWDLCKLPSPPQEREKQQSSVVRLTTAPATPSAVQRHTALYAKPQSLDETRKCALWNSQCPDLERSRLW